MNILLSFSPFIAFAILIHLGFTEAALIAGATVSALLILRERLVLQHYMKILEVGTFVLFGGLALYTMATGQDWSIALVRLVVDGGLLIIVLVSLAVGTPFTLQYAKEATPPAIWANAEFLAANQRITLVWAAAFAVLVVCDVIMAFVPEIPHGVAVAATVGALYVAFRYTSAQSHAGAKATRAGSH